MCLPTCKRSVPNKRAIRAELAVIFYEMCRKKCTPYIILNYLQENLTVSSG